MSKNSARGSGLFASFRSLLLASAVSLGALSLVGASVASADDFGDRHGYWYGKSFQRIATYPVFLNNGPGEDPDEEVTAEIVLR